MQRIITIKGMGKVKVRPDLIILTLKLETRNMEYERALAEAARSITDLQECVKRVGFEKTDLKTTDFNVNTEYESIRDKHDNYKRVFKGYKCSHELKLEFNLDLEKMSQVFSAIAASAANPQFDVSFSIKDKNAISEALLINAADNARAKAQILAKASGVSLGQIVHIDYNWGELHIYSKTRYNAYDAVECAPSAAIDIEPDDIDVSDTVTFVWEIA